MSASSGLQYAKSVSSRHRKVSSAARVDILRTIPEDHIALNIKKVTHEERLALLGGQNRKLNNREYSYLVLLYVHIIK